MDHYPQVNVSEREYPGGASRHDSGSPVNKPSDYHSPPALITQPPQTHSQQSTLSDSESASLPAPLTAAHRNDSGQATTLSDVNEKQLTFDLARYTDAPPPYSVKQYEGKSEEETSKMRMVDYAKEISRQMGCQLLKGTKSKGSKE
jgi:hypothetical protein